jgi:ribosome-binding factor A
MDNQRQQKFAKLIQRDLSAIFQKDIPAAPQGGLATVSHVKVSPDLAVASIYISFMGAVDKAQALAHLEDKNKAIRNELAKRIRNQARVIPELRFFIDNTGEEADRIEKLIASLNIPKETKE